MSAQESAPHNAGNPHTPNNRMKQLKYSNLKHSNPTNINHYRRRGT